MTDESKIHEVCNHTLSFGELDTVILDNQIEVVFESCLNIIYSL